MPDLTKIATCSYCGTRAVLRLKAVGRHELSCTSCGAALHDMKPLKTQRVVQPERKPKPAKPAGVAGPVRKPRKRKKQKPRIWSKIWDEVEDLIDDVFD